MKIGVIGLGYWGPNLVRNFLSQKEVKSIIACDLREERLETVKEKFPSVEITRDCKDIIDGNVDIAVIATPVNTHYKFARKALEAGKHIWVEKPFTSTSEEAEDLIELAEKKNLKIFVDHTFIYNGAVRKIKELVDKKELGNIIYFDSERINLGLFQKDINVVWDLAPHDLSIMNYLLSSHKIKALVANGIANFNGKENLAHLCVYFEDNCFAHFHVNWISPVKIRRIIVGGDKKMLVYDDMENFEKIKVYDSGVEFKSAESIHEALVQYRTGDMFSPKVNQTEALALGAREFISAINENREPLTNGKDGLAVVKLLEAADMSLSNMGKIVEIDTHLVSQI
ncbi:MAG: Gfo/Idh/MocA family oxidoreductase [Ignavibacteriota bacterium]|nr:Gfo/Idh/MocA family oxidoreductase [Ignavibacteriales bacterium]MBL1122301.1 gfo/Idh/MocA family oxidoreductase [Ignavibacteriota bacterium]MCC7093116.1 Gfo/Idh/MocA family oxidoreductase [Ignavibacteriaceae bacterium]MCE7854935.1 gfo/Idh/MocA family oxidoreductase [Ignavibacteria bacterium CHB3]MEB2296222.1 Gfo/Idh/MocA family oxidoreductase [Ignavibacteria bacterium]